MRRGHRRATAAPRPIHLEPCYLLGRAPKGASTSAPSRLAIASGCDWAKLGNPSRPLAQVLAGLRQSFLDIVQLLGLSRSMRRFEEPAAQRGFSIWSPRLSRRRIAAKSPRRKSGGMRRLSEGDMLHSACMERFPRFGKRAVGAVSGGDLPYLAPADPT